MSAKLAGKRVLALGAETEIGAAVASALGEAGATLALVASTADAEAAFAVQRLGRKLGASSQAIDAANEAAVRVMVRQVSKGLGGLDAVLCCTDSPAVLRFSVLYGGKEITRHGQGDVIAVVPEPLGIIAETPPGVELVLVPSARRPHEELAREVIEILAGAPHNG